MNATTHRRWQRLARQRALREVILRRDRPTPPPAEGAVLPLPRRPRR